MSTDHSKLREELLAVTAARRELSPEDESYLIDGFLNRLDTEIDNRVDALIEARLSKMPARRATFQPWVVPAGIGATIPIVAIAGAFAGGVGIIVALVFALAVLGIYAEYGTR
jgi:VIT1/CCC1 family predicted Fe2+/Mn2+ transporter